MKVKELVEILLKYDLEEEVLIEFEGVGYTPDRPRRLFVDCGDIDYDGVRINEMPTDTSGPCILIGFDK